MKRDLSQMLVQPTPCRTCPFEGTQPIMLSQERQAEITANVVNLRSQHLCHSANNKKICRGGRNLMLRVMCIQGFITEPTDEAYDTVRKEILGK
jgi:hypothetical protein